MSLETKKLDSTSRVKNIVRDEYFSALYNRFGEKFIDYRTRWESSIEAKSNNDCKGPIHVDLELMNSCNYRCSFCPYSVDRELRPVGFNSNSELITMPLEKAKRILDQCKEMGASAVEFGYNTEPLLYPDIIELIEYARDIDYIDIRLATNGSLLTEEISKKLILAGLTQLQVSIDAVNTETYKAARNSSLYKRVTSNIQRFGELRNELDETLPVLRVSYVLTPQNRKYADVFQEQWKNIADIIAFQDLFVYENVNDTEASDQNFKDNSQENCYMPKVRLSIKSDGTVHPCCTVPGMALDVGNAFEQSISEIWNSRDFRAIRELHILNNWNKHKICSDCMNNCH